MFCRTHWFRRLSVFGSALREDFRPDSDVDLLVSFEEDARHSLFDLVTMQDEIQAILGREVDLVEREAVEQSESKYPPAEPGALRALAPQRGLTARGGPSKYAIGTPLRLVNHCHTVRSFRNSTLAELSNFGSPRQSRGFTQVKLYPPPPHPPE